MANEKRLINAKPLMEDGWHLVKTGKNNVFLASMSLADAPTVDAVEVVHGRWLELPMPRTQWKYRCGQCGCPQDYKHNYCPHCGAKMDGGNEDG